jgi:hypothetical protein
MKSKKEHNNPQRIFKEQDDLVVQGKKPLIQRDELTSIRQSEITSTVPDDKNWGNIYVGKQHGLYSTKRNTDSKKK